MWMEAAFMTEAAWQRCLQELRGEEKSRQPHLTFYQDSEFVIRR